MLFGKINLENVIEMQPALISVLFNGVPESPIMVNTHVQTAHSNHFISTIKVSNFTETGFNKLSYFKASQCLKVT